MRLCLHSCNKFDLCEVLNMTIKKISPQELRAEAEAKLAAVMKLASCANLNERLVHELGVHQIELEMQNEQLRQMQTALEASRDRYLDLYEFAPVAYLMLDKHGLIQESNLTGATLLGVERSKLIQRRFAGFVDSVDSDRWHLFFTQLLKQNRRKSIDLQLNPPNGKTLYVQLDCLLSLNQEHSPQMRVALTDITERMAIEVRLRVAATAFESQEGMVITDANNNILQVNKAFTNILVSVFESATDIHRIISVDELNTFNPSNLHKKIKGLLHATLLCDVMACCKDVTCIKTDADLGMVFQCFEIVL